MSVWVFLLVCVGQAMSMHRDKWSYLRCVGERIRPAGLEKGVERHAKWPVVEFHFNFSLRIMSNV